MVFACLQVTTAHDSPAFNNSFIYGKVLTKPPVKVLWLRNGTRSKRKKAHGVSRGLWGGNRLKRG